MDWMFIVGLLALIVAVLATSLFFYARPAKDEDGRRRMSRDDEGFLAFLAVCGWIGGIVGVIFMALASFSIIQTGQAGVVRVMGVVQQEALDEGFNRVAPWATVTRQETRGFQIDMTGERALEVLTGNGTRFSVDLSIPVKLNPASVAMVESRINGGNWQGEVMSISRGLARTNVASYHTFGEFNVRRAAAAGQEVIIQAETEDLPEITRTWDNVYGEELAGQIETRVNTLFCDTYGICDVEVVDIGEVIIRKVNAPSAITAEAAALEAAQLAQQTERALNDVEEIRADRREQEGLGYGNLFAFLPEDSSLSAGDAADFLRAAAIKTEADANAYMQRTLAESISEAMSQGRPLPSLIVSTGNGTSPVPMFNTGTQ